MNDYELIYLAQEDNEDAKMLLFEKYNNLINLLISQRITVLQNTHKDIPELYNLCLEGFDTAIRRYDANKKARFATFASVVINQRINNYIQKYNSQKEKNIRNSLSLDFEYQNTPFFEYIADYSQDPLYNITNRERFKTIMEKIKEVLSTFEYEVFVLLLQNLNYQQIAVLLEKTPKQIDNAIQRLKNKIKLILI